ncbi:MAG: hypothetical protein AAFQ24_07140 [Pseudomonadota bacterium]
MKRSLQTKLLGAALIASLCASGAQAQSFGDRFKKLAKKEATEKVEEVINDAAGQSASEAPIGSASASGGASIAPPSQELMDLTQCSDLKVSNVMVGKLGEFTFQQGLSQEERTGFINRRAVTPTNGCILPSLDSYEAIYMEVDTAKFKAMGSFELQCVNSATKKNANDPLPTRGMSHISEKHMMLNCGNSEGIEQCISGSNSDRANAWAEVLESRGTTMLSVHAPVYHNDPGTNIYCQYYNPSSGKSLFGFQFLRRDG